MTTTFLNPSLIDVWRRVPGDTVGPTGGVINTPTQIYSQIPAFVDHATRGVSDKLEFSMPTGEMVEQTDIGFLDGLVPQQFAGYNPGDTVTVDGIDYIVDAEGRGAFPDVQPFDVIVHAGNSYLVLQSTRYDDVEPSIQLHLNFGRAWETPPSPTPTSEDSTLQISSDSSFPGSGTFKVQDGGDADISSSSLTFSLTSTILGTLSASGSSFDCSSLDVDAGATFAMTDAEVFIEGSIEITEDVTIGTCSVFSDQGGVLGYFTYIVSGKEVAFTDATYVDGSNGTKASWAWDFGDSSGTSALQNPSYTYGSDANYSVQLTVTTSTGATSAVTIGITISG